MSEAASLHRVARGIGLVFVGLAMLLLLSYGLMALSGYPASSPFKSDLALLLAALAALCVVIQLAGQLLCLAAPAEVRGRNYLVASLALNLLALGLCAVVVLPGVPHWLDLLPSLASEAAHFAFLLFLRRLAAYLGDGLLEVRAEQVLLYLVVLAFLPYLVLVGLLIFPLLRLAVLGVVFLLILLLPLVVLILYVNLLVNLAHALRRHADTLTDKEKQARAGWVDPPAPW